MVKDIQPQITELFNQLAALLSAESSTDPYNARFLTYVEERHALVKQADADQASEVIRGINRYADEFAFSEANAGKIKGMIEALYDLVNQS